MIELKLVRTIDQTRWMAGLKGGNRRLPSVSVCPSCDCWFGPLERLRQKYCSPECKVESQRKAVRKPRRRASRRARAAQSLVAYHISKGNLIRPEHCEDCGRRSRRIEAAHFDYKRPLDVRWLCVSCHRRWDHAEPKNGTLPSIVDDVLGVDQ